MDFWTSVFISLCLIVVYEILVTMAERPKPYTEGK